LYGNAAVGVERAAPAGGRKWRCMGYNQARRAATVLASANAVL